MCVRNVFLISGLAVLNSAALFGCSPQGTADKYEDCLEQSAQAPTSAGVKILADACRRKQNIENQRKLFLSEKRKISEMSMSEFRATYPMYDDMDDNKLMHAIHGKYFSDVDFDYFKYRMKQNDRRM